MRALRRWRACSHYGGTNIIVVVIIITMTLRIQPPTSLAIFAPWFVEQVRASAHFPRLHIPASPLPVILPRACGARTRMPRVPTRVLPRRLGAVRAPEPAAVAEGLSEAGDAWLARVRCCMVREGRVMSCLGCGV